MSHNGLARAWRDGFSQLREAVKATADGGEAAGNPQRGSGNERQPSTATHRPSPDCRPHPQGGFGPVF